MNTHGFVEHTRLSVLVFSRWAVNETVAEDVIVYATVPAHSVGRRACEPLHTVVREWTF